MSFWNDERIGTLRKLASEGLIAVQIMLAMEAPSVGSVIKEARRSEIEIRKGKAVEAVVRLPNRPGPVVEKPSPPVVFRGSFWTDERVDELRRLAADGLSARQIALAMGAASRMVIIGKMQRMNINGRPRGYPFQKSDPRPPVERRAAPKPAPALKPVAPRVSRQPRRAAEPIREQTFAPPTNDNVPLPQIMAGQCRWPMGDPRDVDGFRFCGATAVLTWCPYHYSLVYRPGANGSQRERRRMALAAE